MKKQLYFVSALLAASIALSSCTKNGNNTNSSHSETNATTSTSPVVSETTSTVNFETPATNNQGVSPIKASSIPDICKSKYGYYQLSADEKAVYDQIVSAARSFQPSVSVSRPISKEQLKRICNIIYIEENDLYYLTKDYELSRQGDVVNTVFLTYAYTPEKVNEINQQVDNRLKAILSKITPDMKTVDKIKLFHDQIIYNCVYTKAGEYIATPYGALIKGQALCEGYARSFALLCNKAGIENLYASGTVTEGSESGVQHMWNMVRVDGLWYNIDVTADDPNAPDGYPFLGYDYITYNYFLFPTSQVSCQRPHIELDQSLYTFPKATSMNANYFVYYGYYAKTSDEGIEILTKSINEAIKNKRSYVRIRFATTEAYDEAVQKLFAEKGIFSFNLDKVNLWRSRDLCLFQLGLIYDE